MDALLCNRRRPCSVDIWAVSEWTSRVSLAPLGGVCVFADTDVMVHCHCGSEISDAATDAINGTTIGVLLIKLLGQYLACARDLTVCTNY